MSDLPHSLHSLYIGLLQKELLNSTPSPVIPQVNTTFLMHDTFVRSCFGERGGILPLRRMKTVVRVASLMWNSLHKLNTQIKMEPMDTSPGAAITSGGSTSTGSASVKSLSLKIPTSHLKRPLLPYTHEGGEFPTPSPEPGPSGAPSEGSLSPYPSKHKKRKSEHKHKKKNKHKQKHKHRSY